MVGFFRIYQKGHLLPNLVWVNVKYLLETTFYYFLFISYTPSMSVVYLQGLKQLKENAAAGKTRLLLS